MGGEGGGGGWGCERGVCGEVEERGEGAGFDGCGGRRGWGARVGGAVAEEGGET